MSSDRPIDRPVTEEDTDGCYGTDHGCARQPGNLVHCDVRQRPTLPASLSGTWRLTSTRLIRDGEKGERGGMEAGGGEEGDYIPIATRSPPEGFLH